MNFHSEWLLDQFPVGTKIGLIWDKAPAHGSVIVQRVLDESTGKLKTVFIHGGMTSVLQVLVLNLILSIYYHHLNLPIHNASIGVWHYRQPAIQGVGQITVLSTSQQIDRGRSQTHGWDEKEAQDKQGPDNSNVWESR